MTIGAADTVTKVFAAPEVIAFLFARMAGQAGFGDFLPGLVFERDDLRRVAFFQVGLAWSMTRFAAGYFFFPTADFGEAGVRSMREGLELILVTIFARLAADVITIGRRGPRAISRGNAPDRSDCRSAENK